MELLFGKYSQQNNMVIISVYMPCSEKEEKSKIIKKIKIG
jgi:hypothetical protein